MTDGASGSEKSRLEEVEASNSEFEQKSESEQESLDQMRQSLQREDASVPTINALTDRIEEEQSKADEYLENEVPGRSEQSSDSQIAELDPLAGRRLKAPPVDKTKLDVDAVIDMAASAKSEQAARLRQELETRAPELLKPFQPVENYRMASRCSSISEINNKEERVSYCEQCHLRVYDFSGVERTEADELVFKMEGRRDVALFKRPDGKFLTSNCPVGVRAKLINIAATAFGAATMIGLVALLLTQASQAPARSTAPAAALKDRSSARAPQNVTKIKTGKESGATSTATGPFSNVVSLDAIAEYQRTHNSPDAASAGGSIPNQQAPTDPLSIEGTGAATQSPIPTAGQPPAASTPNAEHAATPSNPMPVPRPSEAPATLPVGSVLAPAAESPPSAVLQPTSTSGNQPNQNPYVKNYSQ